MQKKKKRRLRIAIFALVALLILAYAGVVLANNAIAGALERVLLSAPLPTQTELVDSISIAGKVQGNGNGMQYFGAILLRSELDEAALEAHYAAYAADADIVEVLPQTSQYVFEYRPYRFSQEVSGENLYRVALWKYSVVGCEDNIWGEILNCDIRGH